MRQKARPVVERSGLDVEFIDAPAEDIPLPPDSVATVVLRRFDTAGAEVVAEQEIALQGRQVPIPFSVTATVFPDAVAFYEVRGSVTFGGEVFRITRPVMVDPTGEVADVGMIRLLPYDQVSFGTHFLCGSEDLLFGAEGEKAQLVIQGQVLDMQQAPAASGVLYRALGDETTQYACIDKGGVQFFNGETLEGHVVAMGIGYLIGGLIIGSVQHDLSLADAVHNYTLLTIGDGLVAQVPSLLLSTSETDLVILIGSSVLGVALAALKVDGGMVFNELLMQFQADILDVPVIRPKVAETTALGAAYAIAYDANGNVVQLIDWSAVSASA